MQKGVPMIEVLILGISILLQFTAAILALRLIKVTKNRWGWGLIALAVFLMAVRRSITFYRLLSGDLSLPPDLLAELVALVISILMVLGIGWIAPIFHRIRHSAEALRRSESRYHTIFETAAVSIWQEDFSEVKSALDSLRQQGVTDFRTYLKSNPDVVRQYLSKVKILDVNKESLHIFGAKSKKELMAAWQKTFVPESFETFREGLISIAEGKTHFEAETVFKSLQGKRINALMRISFPETESDLDMMLVSLMDMTEVKLKEQQIEQRAHQQQVVAELGRLALTKTDFEIMNEAVERVARTLNVEFCKVLELLPDGNGLLLQAGVGWKKAQFGHTVVDADKGSQAGYTLMQRHPVVVEDFRREQRFTPPPLLRDHGMLSGISVIIGEKENPFGVLGAHSSQPHIFSPADVDFMQAVANVLAEAMRRKDAEEDLRKSQEQLAHSQRLETLGTLAGGVAHDLNNVLTAILGNAELGIHDVKSNQAAYLDFVEIKKAAARARGLTNQLLSFSRRQVLQKRNLDLTKIIEELMKMLKRILGEDIELKLKLEPDLAWVFADPGQLQQVLMNLFANSRDAIPEGGTLILETRNLTTEEAQNHPDLNHEFADYVQITLTDDGIGIDEQTLPHIFEPYFTTKELDKGTGLGLSVVFGIIKQHDGHIEVTSEAGKGATFKVYLPAVKDASETSEAAKKDKAPLPTGHGETILVVEDEEAVRNVSVRILNRLGYTTLVAQNATEAMKIFKSEKDSIALVLLDVVMPKKSGPEIYQKMCALRPALPVIFVTGYDIKAKLSTLQHQFKGEHIRMLQKPYTSESLAREIRKVLGE